MAKTNKQIIALINKEIQWTFEHKAENLSNDFQDGFRAGLNQAINIITADKIDGAHSL